MSLEPKASDFMASNSHPPSPRGCLTVPFHPTLDLSSLRAMSDMCSAVTPADVMLYGGIPSLIYSVKAMWKMTPEERFFKKIPRFSLDRGLLKWFVVSVVWVIKLTALHCFMNFS
jgi:hypothetical protein